MRGISATELARNTSAVLDRVISERNPVFIQRGKTVVARITAEGGQMTAAQALQGFNAPILTKAEARAWLKDSRAANRDRLRDPWA